jgi:hypothetical protein
VPRPPWPRNRLRSAQAGSGAGNRPGGEIPGGMGHPLPAAHAGGMPEPGN